MQTWPCGDIRVHYRPELDGRGSVLADPMLRFVRERVAGHVFPQAFEWCAGPGFFGFALLAAGVCSRLCLADINPAAIDCVAATVRDNGLEDRVTWHVSDNFTAVPAHPRFDLVVGNPPNFSRLNPQHPRYALYRDDLRPNDPDWRIHRGFYSGVARHLNPGARLFISEVEPFLAVVHDPVEEVEPFDLRERPAVDDLEPMISAGGLDLEETTRYHVGASGVGLYMMASRRP